MITGPDRSPGRRLATEQVYTIETPEHVEIVYTVAGPGSRLLAFAFDSLVMLAPVILLLAIAIAVLAIEARGWVEDILRSVDPAGDSVLVWIMLASLSMGQFVVANFYFVFFEMIWNGQSPGKRMMRIRVMLDSGRPIGFASSMIRNLLRIADSLPLFYAAGFVAMLASRNWRRLGDLASGSIVVKIGDPVPTGVGGPSAAAP